MTAHVPESQHLGGARLSGIDATLDRLDDQIDWYDRKSAANQRWFKAIKVGVMVAAAIIPFSAGFGGWTDFTAGLGVVIVVLEGLLQLNQYQHNWITYRSTCESLKHEKFLYLARAGPYAGDPQPELLLAEQLESLVSQEHAKWASSRRQEKQAPDSRQP